MSNGSRSRGRFITFEGGEGAGKSTQIARLSDYLDQAGVATVRTREPGGTPGAEEIRALLVTGDPDRWDATTEALLNTAARRNHVESVIRPALAAGTWVLCDRFADSTSVYQGYAGGVPLDGLQGLYDFAIGDLKPDLTIVLDVPVEEGLRRAGKRTGNETRFEERELSFHEAVRNGFLTIARQEPARCAVFDTTQQIDTVTAGIQALVEERLLSGG